MSKRLVFLEPITKEQRDDPDFEPCHTPAPRGSRDPGSTQGKVGAMERGRIPPELCEEIWEAVNGNGGGPGQHVLGAFGG